MGDILPHQYPTIEVPSTAFHLVGFAARVPTVVAISALLPTWTGEVPVLRPNPEDAPETEVIRPRHIQLIPGCYAALLLRRRGVTPKMAYQEIVGAINAHHEAESCQETRHCLVTCSLHGEGWRRRTNAHT